MSKYINTIYSTNLTLQNSNEANNKIKYTNICKLRELHAFYVNLASFIAKIFNELTSFIGKSDSFVAEWLRVCFISLMLNF